MYDCRTPAAGKSVISAAMKFTVSDVLLTFCTLALQSPSDSVTHPGMVSQGRSSLRQLPPTFQPRPVQQFQQQHKQEHDSVDVVAW